MVSRAVQFRFTLIFKKNDAEFLEGIIQRCLQNLKILIRMVRGVTIAQPSPTCNHLNKRMNPWLIRNAIAMLVERTLSLHLPPHFSKNHSWYMESSLKLFFCICQRFSIEILLLQLLEVSLKIMFYLFSSSWRRPTPLVLVFVLRFIFVKTLHHKHGKKANNVVMVVIMGLHDVE